MKTIDEKKRFLAYKLLEWAGTCNDQPSFVNLPNSQIDNALREAESILAKLET